MKEEKRLKDNWEEEFNLIRRNPIYFIDLYWNKLFPDEMIELSDEEKQKFYNKYRIAPLLNDNNIHEYFKQAKELRDKGVKDWEAFL
ncbi:hypothetical protein [Parabacteroides provencensis]|uniref:hypothetical protein n=1 Tax=Parabacteroides provencensis TaxID=1944636 RepID=UPI000C162062|nr:hypothetical protein [Parabacteroides provencensis]